MMVKSCTPTFNMEICGGRVLYVAPAIATLNEILDFYARAVECCGVDMVTVVRASVGMTVSAGKIVIGGRRR